MELDRKADILLVDDTPANLLVLEAILGNLRQNLVKAQSGAAALRYLMDHDVAIILMDVQMPGMDGFEFLAQARRNPALDAVPIVMFSSSRAPRDVLRCYRLGANSFITKPMSLETFVATIRTLVRYWLDIVELPDPGMVD